MILLIECLIAIASFTLIVVPMDLKNPLSVISDYPPAIRKRCEELGLVGKSERRFSAKDLVKKALAIIVLVAAAVLVMIHIKQSCIGTFLGIPASAVVGLFVVLVG